jgi:hypothetical protein
MWREMRYKIILSGIYVKICKSSKHNTYCMYQLLHFVNERIHVFLVIHRANTSYYVISSLCWKRSVFSMWYELNFLILLRRPSLSLSLPPLQVSNKLRLQAYEIMAFYNTRFERKNK